MPSPDYDRGQLKREYIAQRMQYQGRGRLAEAASCLGCLLKLIILIVIVVVLVTVAGELHYHFTTGKPMHWW